MIIYNWIFHFAENTDKCENGIDEMKSFIYFIFDNKLYDCRIKKNDTEKLKLSIMNLIQAVIKKGFYLPEKNDPYGNREITRKDLFDAKVK